MSNRTGAPAAHSASLQSRPVPVPEVGSAADALMLKIGRRAFNKQLRQLDEAACIVGTVRQAIEGDAGGYHSITLAHVLHMIEGVASELAGGLEDPVARAAPEAREPAAAAVEAESTASESTRGRSNSEPAVAAVPPWLAAHLSEQEARASELKSLLEQLDEDEDAPLCTRVAVRMANDLEKALARVTLGKILAKASPAGGDAESQP